MLGKILDGRYKVIQVLRAGGFGQTYIVEDTRRPGNPRCVLKLLKPANSDQAAIPLVSSSFSPKSPTSPPISDFRYDSKISPQATSLSFLNQALSVIRFIPFIGATGLFFFKSTTWIILLAVGITAFGVGLFFLRSWYSNVARDYDAIFAVMFCICGILLLFQNQYVKPEIQLSQFLLSGIGIFSAAECIRLRSR